MDNWDKKTPTYRGYNSTYNWILGPPFSFPKSFKYLVRTGVKGPPISNEPLDVLGNSYGIH